MRRENDSDFCVYLQGITGDLTTEIEVSQFVFRVLSEIGTVSVNTSVEKLLTAADGNTHTQVNILCLNFTGIHFQSELCHFSS